MARRRLRGALQYLVHWAPPWDDPGHDSWEPAANVPHSMQADFDATKRKRPIDKRVPSMHGTKHAHPNADTRDGDGDDGDGHEDWCEVCDMGGVLLMCDG